MPAVCANSTASYAPERHRYSGLRYRPPEPDTSTATDGPVVARFLEAARARGIVTQLQVQAAIPPGYRVQFGGGDPEDEPLLPDGSRLERRVDKNGSLASPHIRAYLVALLQDLAAAYPMVDAVRLDWPEYPPYTLESCFVDFSAHARAAAVRLGYDVELMRRDCAAALSGLLAGAVDTESACTGDGGRYALGRALQRLPGIVVSSRFKADLVVELLTMARAALPEAVGLVPQTFPPPWSLASGFDCSRAAAVADGIGVKLYTMHWPMMARFYAEALGSTDAAARLVVDLLDIGAPASSGFADLDYPGPGVAHPVGADAQRRKLEAVVREAGPCPVFAFAHSYGPADDALERFRIAWDAPVAGVWINRYGYLSDEKLRAIGRAVG
ncbi:MAG: hypothetical protein AAFX81_03945 [Pseudomonadota bacterium]